MQRFFGLLLFLTYLILPGAGLSAEPPIRSLDALRRVGVLHPKPTVFAHPMSSARTEYSIGDVRSLWTYDLSVMPPKNVSISSTCQGVGETVVVFVADSEWGTKVAHGDVEAIIQAFDVDTPNGTGAGIMATNVALFGEMSDVDGDPRLLVFIYAIPGYQGQAFDGFFRPEDLAPYQPGCESNPMNYCSNETEMIHVNSLNAGSDYMIGVMAHEFQHLIHHAHDQNEESWINEAMSELAMSANGYEDAGHLYAYLANHTKPLVTAEFVHYGAVMLWGTFLYERFGDTFIRAVVNAPQNGVVGLEAAWQGTGFDTSFKEAFAQWALANVVDGYTLLDLPDVNPDGALPVFQDGYASSDVTVPPYTYHWLAGPIVGAGAQQDLIVSIENASDATLRVAGFSGEVLVEATATPAGGWRIGANVDEVIVALGNPNGSGASLKVGFELVGLETTPEAQVSEVIDGETGGPDGWSPDLAVDAVLQEDGIKEGVASDAGSGCEEGSCYDEGGGSSGCSLSDRPVTGPSALFLLMSVLVVIRRRLQATP